MNYVPPQIQFEKMTLSRLSNSGTDTTQTPFTGLDTSH